MKLIYCVVNNVSARDLITCALDTADFKAVGFEESLKFYDALKKVIPDLIILDMILPKVDGMTILNDLKNNGLYKNIPIIMIAVESAEMDKVKGLESGADDFITNPFGVLELIARIKAVLRRSEFKEKEQDIVELNGIFIDYKKREASYCNNELILTYKEFNLLYFLLINKGIVLSRDKILNKIWGYKYNGTIRTVDINIRTLRQKLKDAGCTNLIKTVVGVGYKFEDKHEQ